MFRLSVGALGLLIGSLAGVLALTTATRPAPDPPPAPFPDRSDPKAALYSLAVALGTGDERAARAVFPGADEPFARLVEASVARAKSGRRLRDAAAARFGGNAALLGHTDPHVRLGDVTLAGIILSGTVEEKGAEAAVVCKGRGYDVTFRLRKAPDGWRVAEFPPLVLTVIGFWVTAQAQEEVAGGIERGEYRTAHEAHLAAAAKALSGLSKSIQPAARKDGGNPPPGRKP